MRHVLLDADGVLQTVPDDWREQVTGLLGPDPEPVMADVLVAEKPSLRGETDFLVDLAAVLERHAAPTTAEELYARTWARIEQVPGALALVGRLRAAGYGVHLGTNQHAQRAARMRTELGYDDLFDVSVYSCDLGVAKPDPAYFVRAAELVGADPAEICFVDDKEANVEAARGVGMAAVGWERHQGLALLERRLAAVGVRPAPA